MGQLAAFDMDGTLLLPDHTLGNATLETLQALQQNKITLTFATGRHYLDMVPQIAPLKLDAWFITGNGTRIHDAHGQVHLTVNLTSDVAEEVICHDWRTSASLHVFMDEGWFADRDDPQILAAHHASGFVYQLHDLRMLPMNSIAKLCFTGEHKELGQLLAKLQVVLSHRAALCFSAPHCLEVLPLNCNKGAALRWLTNSLNIPLENCMAFGDAMNDLEMLELVGKGFVMGNAMPQLKSALPHLPVIGTCATQAVSQFLNSWLIAQKLLTLNDDK